MHSFEHRLELGSAADAVTDLVRKGWAHAGLTGYGEDAWTHKDGWSAVHCHRSYWGPGKSGLAVRAHDGKYFYLPYTGGWVTDLLP